MKVKKLVYLILTIIFIIGNVNNSISYANPVNNNNNITEEEYIRTIRLLLYPYLSKEVQNRYGEYAHINSYDMDIKSISIEPNAKIKVDIIFRPFIGAHNIIATDKATFLIGNDKIEIINYIFQKSAECSPSNKFFHLKFD